MLAVAASGVLLAQAELKRSLPVIHLADRQYFCPSAPIEVAPDSITDGTPPFLYEWSNNNIILNDDSTFSVVLEDTTIFQLTITDSEGKIARDSLLMIPHQAIDASFQVSRWEGCSPVEIVFTSNYLAFQNITTMQWDFGNGYIEHQLASVVHTFEDDGFYVPHLQVTDLFGCVWKDSLHIGIRVFPTPHASFTVLDERLYLPETSLQLKNLSTGADQYVWYYNGASAQYDFEPNIEFPQQFENTYNLELTATNAFGCSDKMSKTIEVVQAIELYLPNAFTPDGDGINDSWQLKGLGIDAFHISLEIYDVWGTVVFSSDSQEAIWDAGYLSREGLVPSGQYNYRILARDTERGIGHLFEGHVLVLY